MTGIIVIKLRNNKSKTHQGGRVVSASGTETSISSSTPAGAIIYDACTSIIKKKKKNSFPRGIATVKNEHKLFFSTANVNNS